jgi:hypothetical protein
MAVEVCVLLPLLLIVFSLEPFLLFETPVDVVMGRSDGTEGDNTLSLFFINLLFLGFSPLSALSVFSGFSVQNYLKSILLAFDCDYVNYVVSFGNFYFFLEFVVKNFVSGLETEFFSTVFLVLFYWMN